MVRLAVFALVCAFPAVASAQAWADPYRAGDYEKCGGSASRGRQQGQWGTPLLETSRSRPSCSRPCMREGKGLLPIRSWRARWRAQRGLATHMRVVPGEDGRSYQARLDASDAFVHRHCDPLAPDDRVTAERASAVRVRDAGRNDRVRRSDRADGRRGISVADSDGQPWKLMGCPKLVARVRTTSLIPPPDAAPGKAATLHRDIHVGRGNEKRSAVYSLNWDVYEVADQRILFFMVAQDLVTRPAWPGRGLPAEIEKGLTLEMIRTGHVRWKGRGRTAEARVDHVGRRGDEMNVRRFRSSCRARPGHVVPRRGRACVQLRGQWRSVRGGMARRRRHCRHCPVG